MSHFSLALQQYIQPVPACESTVSLEALQSLFETSQHEIVVVISEQQTPLGAIAFKTLMPYLTRKARPCYNPARAQSVPDTERFDPSPFDLRALVTPIASLPAKMSVKDFLSYLQAGQLDAREGKLCALVDESGKFQGILDSWRLFSSLLPIYGDLESLPPPISPLPNWAALLQLLDRLPIPLMLQTARGQIRYQNQTWREQMGEKNDSARGPGAENTETSHGISAWCNLTSESELPISPARSSTLHASETSLKGSNSSVATVWQFIKLPLEMSADWDLGRASLASDSPIAHLQSPMWLILATDITEQRQLCKELAAKNADLVQLNRLKDEFLACISHELKTPLTAVLGLSSLLKDRKLGELTPRQERYAQLIYQSGRQLMTVVNDLLDLTRIEAGQLKLNVEPVKIEESCNRAYEQARSHLANKHAGDSTADVRFTLEIEPGLTTIIADELRLRQMLVHLLDNALKFTPADGEIGLGVSRWEGWIEFTVWDTGIGIPEDSQHLIFQKFQQLESPLTRQFEGTGLGLVLTQRLARAHGGDISFISKIGEGSQFTLLLPPSPPGYPTPQNCAKTERSPKGTSLPSSLLKPSNPLILIVESALQTIEQLNDQLQKLGYRVAIARSGTEALEKARGLQPRAILLNPIIPLLSGWDVLTLLKADEKTQDIPVAIAATRAEKDIALQNGADGFLALPADKAALQEMLYRLGEQSQMRDRGVTILRLNPEGTHVDPKGANFAAEFDQALLARSAKLNYRILATDDLEQAEILARVWQPDVLLLDGFSLEDPGAYLQSLKNHDRLAALPLVTLDAKITEAANQVKGLFVFPCLVPANQQGITALLQVIGIATGLSHQPRILIVGNWQCGKGSECGMLRHPPEDRENCALWQSHCSRPNAEVARDPEKTFFPHERFREAGEAEFLQALVQYLDKAGLKSFLTCTWTEVYSQIQHQGVDLLLLYLGQHGTLPLAETLSAREFLLKELRQLAQLPIKPPILVLDRRDSPREREEAELNAVLQEVATCVLQGHSHSCADLLEQIHQVLPG